jgi:sugar O-acyltransferase (sialic acid O-acetyltransferase NeuD family)
MTDSLLLVGAGGLAREVQAAGIAGVVGILDDDPALQGSFVGGAEVVGTIGDAAGRDERMLVCVGPGAGRRSIVRRLREAGVTDDRFATFVAPSARVGAGCTVGVGVILLDGVVVTADAELGDHVVVMPNCTVTHDDSIGDFATLAAGVALGGGVRVGTAAYLGMNSSVRQGVAIGEGATVGMGAVVLEDVPPHRTWAGVPARDLGAQA